ncbi:MAG: Bug family tripartite tricarboxylate transporter substrate binding protein [Pigmentiphaga sp.]|nr:Bug family tripartite tricarboxylate transporter substrate binding protein [Pigmentiphaga sp.]
MPFIAPLSWLKRGAYTVALATGLAASTACFAQSSSAPVRILVGFAPGGGVDAVARHLADALGRELNQPFIVENRAGAGGKIAAIALTQAAPDGQTLFLSNDHTVVIIPLTTKDPGFDPAADLAPIGNVAQIAMGFAVHPSTRATNLQEFAAWARQNAQQANVGVPAPASVPEFAVNLIADKLDIEANPIAYRGGAPMALDLLAGQIHAGITAPSELLQHEQAGGIRIIAVSGTERSPLLPNVPTFIEEGIEGLELSNFLSLFAPAGTPEDVIQRYNTALSRVLQDPGLRDKLAALGMEPDYTGPDGVRSNIRQASETWSSIIEKIGFQPQ